MYSLFDTTCAFTINVIYYSYKIKLRSNYDYCRFSRT